MRTNAKNRASIALILVLAIVLVSAMGVTVFGNVASAAGNETFTSLGDTGTISVGHLSDIHYFPLEHCYQDVYGENYAISDFYHSTTGDTKLVVESGIVLNATIKNILEDAKKGEAPTYLVASGDLSKNGERVALIDVANTLRYLQNEMRNITGEFAEKYKNFQVFATVGNHDLYNHNGALYEQTEGKERPADMVTAMQFAMIFAGLGFPNADIKDGDGVLNLTDYLPEEYWSSNYTSGYVASKNADNLNISYYSAALTEAVSKTTSEDKLASYLKIGNGLNQLTYFAEITDKEGYSFAMIDSTDREATDSGALVRVTQAEYAALPDIEKTGLYIEKADSTLAVDIDLSKTVSEAVAFPSDGKVLNVYRRTPVQHITGGRITTACLDWVETQANKQHAKNEVDGNLEETIISSFHHNVLPHFEQEDDILKDFTLYNWEYTANRLLNMGVRYALTGHMHASDAMTYTDIEGRTLYDFETGSIISYASPRRYVTFERNDCNGKLGEMVTSQVRVLGDIREYASERINDTVPWDDAAYQTKIAEYNALMATDHTEEQREAAWNAVVATNPNYLTYIIRYDEFAKLNREGTDNANMYNDFISQDIYAIIVDRMVDHFLNQSTIDGLVNTASNFVGSLDGKGGMVETVLGILDVDGRTLQLAANYMIDTVLNNLYGASGYPFNGKTYDTALDYLVAVVNSILDLKFGDDNITSTTNPSNSGKLNVRELASFIMMAHSSGTEIDPINETNETIDANFEETPNIGDQTDVVAQRRYKQPSDRTYRKRMLAAIKDFDAKLQIAEGGVVEMLLNGILDPLFNNNNSLLKQLLDYKFDFINGVDWDEDVVDSEFDEEVGDYVDYLVQPRKIKALFEDKLNSLVTNSAITQVLSGFGITLPKDISLSFDPEAVSLNDIVNRLLPTLKPIIGDLLGFNMQGNSLVEIVDNLLKDYVTDSFKIGLGGIAGDIVMAFATDVYPDVENLNAPTAPYKLQPYKTYTYADQAFAYVGSKNKLSAVGNDKTLFNAATQANGRVPSRVTANFDTRNSTTAFTVKFYTAEDVYGTFKYKTSENGQWISLSTSKANAEATYANKKNDYFDSTATATTDGIKVEMLTQTKPVYLPLIDLGLLCLTHAEVEYDLDKDHKDVPYKYNERDNAPKNSIVYWNVTTVTVTGLEPDTTYYYDLEGSYVNGNKTAQFSFAQYNKLNCGYDKDYFTFTTAKNADSTDFEFLTIADIQGMIQGMYSNSFNAVEALLKDDRTKNFDFILNAGDMCDNGKNFNQWGYALNTYQKLFANSSMFFAAGNHENGSNALANYFNYTLPYVPKDKQQNVKDGMYFSFDYANAHFVVLNTNDADGKGLGKNQLDWLTNDLNASKAKWKFVLMHKSIFSGGSHSTDSEVVAMRNQLVPLFANTGVSIVFGGHDHTYTSTHLIDKDGNIHEQTADATTMQSGNDGVLYLTLGTMGTKFYEYKENSDILNKFDEDNSILETLTTQTFGKVSVSGDTLTYTSYSYDSTTKTLQEIGSNQISAPTPKTNNGDNDGDEQGKKPLSKGAIIGIVVAVVVVVVGAVVAVVVVLVVKKKQEEKRRKEALRRKKIAMLKARQAAAAKAAEEKDNGSSDNE